MTKHALHIVALLGLAACAPQAQTAAPEAAAVQPASYSAGGAEPVVMTGVACEHLTPSAQIARAECQTPAASQGLVDTAQVPCREILPEFWTLYPVCAESGAVLATAGVLPRRPVDPVDPQDPAPANWEYTATSYPNDNTQDSNTISTISLTDGVRETSQTSGSVTTNVYDGMDIRTSSYWNGN